MKKILLIDDDQDLLRSFQIALENQGFSVFTAENGKNGYEKLQSELPDLLVVDLITKNKLEGINLIHKIKEQAIYKDLPVILLTGMSDQPAANSSPEVDEKVIFPNVHFQDIHVDPIRLGIMIHKMLESA